MANHSLLVQGWRFYGHSYSIVNQWQLLELLRRPGIAVHVEDQPPENPGWRPVGSLLPADQVRLLQSLRPAGPGTRIDSTLRIVAPISLGADDRRTWVFCTADAGWLPRRLLRGGRSFAEAVRGSPAALVTPSRWSKSGLVRSGAAAERVHVVPHGVDPAVFRPADAAERDAIRKALGWQDRFVFFNVSAMSLNKGIDLVLRAFARVARARPEALLMLKGADPVFGSIHWLRQWWRDMLSEAERAACAGRVHYVGGLRRHDEIADLYRAADAYVTPYRSEGFNLPGLEAAACGLPVICTDGGPALEYATADFALPVEAARISGLPDREPEETFFEPDLDRLTARMFEIADDAAFRERARLLAPRHVQAHWTWRHAVDRLLAVIGAGG